MTYRLEMTRMHDQSLYACLLSGTGKEQCCVSECMPFGRVRRKRRSMSLLIIDDVKEMPEAAHLFFQSREEVQHEFCTLIEWEQKKM